MMNTRNAWRYTAVSHDTFISWCLIKHRHNLTFMRSTQKSAHRKFSALYTNCVRIYWRIGIRMVVAKGTLWQGVEWGKLAQAKAQWTTTVDIAINFQILFWGIPWVAEQLLGSQKRLCCTNWVGLLYKTRTNLPNLISLAVVKNRIVDGSNKRQGEEHII